jgi:hypothetical protein
VRTLSFYIFGIIFLTFDFEVSAQNSLGGFHGHLIVPSAYNLDKSSFMIGATHYPGRHLYINRPTRKGRTNDERYYFITLNYLERLDITLNISRIVNVETELNGIGDRSMNIKFLAVKEKPIFPAIALALEVPGGNNNWFASNAILASKNFSNFTITTGYGLPLVLERNVTGNIGTSAFYGSLFGYNIVEKSNEYLSGILFSLTKKTTITRELTIHGTAEYDGTKINAGFNFEFRDHNFNFYFPGLNSIAFGLSLSGLIR